MFCFVLVYDSPLESNSYVRRFDVFISFNGKTKVDNLKDSDTETLRSVIPKLKQGIRDTVRTGDIYPSIFIDEDYCHGDVAQSICEGLLQTLVRIAPLIHCIFISLVH